MPTHFLAWKQAFHNHGVAFTLERFYALAGMPSDRIIRILSEESGVPLDPQALSVEKEENFLKLIDQVPPVARVVELARSEKGRRKLAVASGGFRWVIDQQLAHIGLGDWFDAIVTAEDTELHKPHPDVFLEAARQLGVRPENCLVFEDAELGLEAARRAGMASIDVRGAEWGSSSV